jgi:NitT/TauT family transport system ATP-binding protein
MSDTAFVHAESVSVTYPGPVQALDGISFDVPAGQFLSVVGPSGCGKSTLLRLLAGLGSPTAGKLSVAGLPPAQARRGGVRLSFVFQDPTLLPWRSVAANVRLPLELMGRMADCEPVVHQRLTKVGLGEFAHRRPAQLSGGMRMRVSLARALVTDPELLLLDEPFGALDDITRQALNEDLSGLWQERRWTAVFVTHNIAEAVFLSQRVLVLGPRPGRIVADLSVPFGYPRLPELRGQGEFAQLAAQVAGRLRRACA